MSSGSAKKLLRCKDELSQQPSDCVNAEKMEVCWKQVHVLSVCTKRQSAYCRDIWVLTC